MVVDLCMMVLMYMNQYRVETAYDLGSLIMQFSVIETLLFYPNKTEINNYDITAVSFNLDETLQSTGIGEIASIIDDFKRVLRRRNNYYL